MDEKKVWQLLTFGLLWLAYASTYLLRKPIGLVKGDIQTELKIPSGSLGWLDTALLLPYAAVALLFGGVADKAGPRLTLGGCLIVASLANAPIGTCGSLPQMMILLFLSGAAQALCWPSACTLIGKWFPDEIRSTVFGLFGSSCFIGGILGTAIAVYLQTVYGWRSAFFIPSLIVMNLAILVLLFVKEPHQRNIQIVSSVGQTNTSEQPNKQLSFREVWSLSLVPEISIAMFCIKSIRFAMFMWLPLYLLRVQGYSKELAGLASTSFEIGGMIGSLSVGVLVDRVFKGKPLLVCSVAACGSGLALVGLVACQHMGPVAHFVCLALAGALNCSPDVVLAGAVANQIGAHHGASSAVVAVVNGMGSLGTVLEGPMVAFVADAFGFNAMFPFMMVVSLIAALACQKAHRIQCARVLYKGEMHFTEA